MTGDTTRPPIPQPMKREVRRRCAFGCVLCGHPIYEYHHMSRWADGHKHEADNITLLCDLHHKQVTIGQLDDETVREANAAPRNRGTELSAEAGPLWYHRSNIEFMFGRNSFQMDPGVDSLLMVEGLRFGARIEDNRWLLTLIITAPSGAPILHIVDNELTHSTDTWDTKYDGTKLIMRNGPRKVFLRIDFRPPQVIIEQLFLEPGEGAFVVDQGRMIMLGAGNAQIESYRRRFSV